MAYRKVLHEGDETLRKTSKQVVDFDKNLWSATAERKTLQEKDGYSGYEITMRVSYTLLGETRTSALGRIAVMPAMRNSVSMFIGQWVSIDGADWYNMVSYPIVNSDGTIPMGVGGVV